jgi:hypothetical protein|tara:strand:+ start:635 stop:787 length:153 start_codon:yes stop_codon:yes gene_type:complete
VSDGGKENKRRPVDQHKFKINFDKIFEEKIKWEDEIKEEDDNKLRREKKK